MYRVNMFYGPVFLFRKTYTPSPSQCLNLWDTLRSTFKDAATLSAVAGRAGSFATTLETFVGIDRCFDGERSSTLAHSCACEGVFFRTKSLHQLVT